MCVLRQLEVFAKEQQEKDFYVLCILISVVKGVHEPTRRWCLVKGSRKVKGEKMFANTMRNYLYTFLSVGNKIS